MYENKLKLELNRDEYLKQLSNYNKSFNKKYGNYAKEVAECEFYKNSLLGSLDMLYKAALNILKG